MNKKIIACLCIFLSVLIMLMPVCVKMSFSGEKAVSYYSYFSMIPAGYGNYIRFLQAVFQLCFNSVGFEFKE